jgi:hydrogenase expression/formation protein HypC
MCLAVPGKVTSVDGDMATVDYGGITRQANVSLVNASVGTYVLIHAGYAIEVLDEKEARKTLELWNEILTAMEKQG